MGSSTAAPAPVPQMGQGFYQQPGYGFYGQDQQLGSSAVAGHGFYDGVFNNAPAIQQFGCSNATTVDSGNSGVNQDVSLLRAENQNLKASFGRLQEDNQALTVSFAELRKANQALSSSCDELRVSNQNLVESHARLADELAQIRKLLNPENVIGYLLSIHLSYSSQRAPTKRLHLSKPAGLRGSHPSGRTFWMP